MTSTRRHLRRSVVSLIFGAVVTVLVSWVAVFIPLKVYWEQTQSIVPGGGISLPTNESFWTVTQGRNALCRVNVYSSVNLTLSRYYDTSFLLRQIELNDIPASMQPEVFDHAMGQPRVVQAGWPTPAMKCEMHSAIFQTEPYIRYQTTGGIELPSVPTKQPMVEAPTPRAVPLIPVFPGFLINTLLYAMIWLGTTLRFGAWRSHRRIKRGKCAQCGYLREGLDAALPCPECGCVPNAS
ncbi:MAG: hypothetical protein H6815_12495 [Phycisphaeraceae bacterium]|nr:hypothetical protein [Phycisphaerales bacterium]MCB9861260.1 hypothetical protein [Phycisphaeraceae bacterium]